MSGKHLSSEDRRELNRMIKILGQKVVQIIVQSRLGEKAHTASKTPQQGSDWFHLAIHDMPEIQCEIKKHISGQAPDVGKPLVVEISLRTPENALLVLELWTLSVMEAYDTSPARANQNLYNRMTVLLKSLLAVTRITPAYKFSFRQGVDSYIICYRMFLGEPNYSTLGEKYVQSRIGQVTTPLSTLVLSVCYRTSMTITPHRIDSNEPIMLKSDHFKPEVSPKHCRRNFEKTSDSGEAQISDESQDAVKLFTVSPQDHPSTPRSRTNSDSSGRSQPQLPERKISAAFADAKTVAQALTETGLDMPEIPFASLLIAKETQQEKKADKGDSQTQTPVKTSQPAITCTYSTATTTTVVGTTAATTITTGMKTGALPKQTSMGEKTMTSSGTSHKSNTSAIFMKEEDFVMVDLKTPFGDQGESGSDLGAFLRECKNAPQLHLFSETAMQQYDDQDTLCDLSKQLQSFEESMEEYNELVRSLHSDSPNSPD
ncbi:autophagy-related 13 isoform X2 [Oratosquilla oratoria]|uniref:autophagy-related 13 isoform X2 n=1 Tax=Oratosquilla oratoria TaxID=337810 RepID=UPI003F7769D3